MWAGDGDLRQYFVRRGHEKASHERERQGVTETCSKAKTQHHLSVHTLQTIKGPVKTFS